MSGFGYFEGVRYLGGVGGGVLGFIGCGSRVFSLKCEWLLVMFS